MSHVEFDRLWALEQGTLGEAEAAGVRAHLEGCPACAAQLKDIELARPMMMPPPVPELDAARWSAIDDKVLSAVAAEMARPSLWRTLRSWWETPVLKPALAFAAMAAVALVVVLAPRSSTVTVPEPLPPEPIAALPGELVNEAAVVSAVESSSDAVELKAAKKVAKGARVATRAQGEAWLRLPDGSKLGVLASSVARLDDLAPKSVRVSLDRGALAVAAVHEPDRLLEVSAGRLSVRAVSTRFMVMRDAQSSGVVVEEGMVEANVDGRLTMVPAGSSLTVDDRGGVVLDEVQEPERREMQVIVPPRPLVKPQQPKPLVLPVADAPDAAVVAMVQPAPEEPAPAPVPDPAQSAAAEPAPAEPAPEPGDVDEDWLTYQPQAEPEPEPGTEPGKDPGAAQAGVPQPPAVPSAAVAGERSFIQRTLDNLSRAHCRRVYSKVDEMLIEWPKRGVVMTRRRQNNLNQALKERDRCIQRWGYPIPK